MSQPAQTQMSCELAGLLCLHYQQDYLKGEELSAPGAKHTFVFPELYGCCPRLDREPKLSVKYGIAFTTQDMVRVDRRSPATHNYISSVKKKEKEKDIL